MRSFIVAAVIAASLTSCTVKVGYTPPPSELPETALKTERIIDRPFDDTWQALISGISGGFFGIKNFEKASGLMTLEVAGSPPSTLIESGHFVLNNSSQATGARVWLGQSVQRVKFDGPFCDFLAQYHAAQLLGVVNLVAAPVDDAKTKITTNIRYVLTGTSVSYSWNSGASCRGKYSIYDKDFAPLLYSNGTTERELHDAITNSLKTP